ncbi:thiolase family protein [Deinococcus pimensis]|uniref:thiolase family protein n=1 Tax=Deinococcus pimensis TaxID=309888 RepID=UPI0004827151|nr:acetyl-CoA C-acyltransferase [Deinococcus pimensis]
MPEAVILSAVRTPVGKYGGALSAVRPDDLAALVLREAITRAGVPDDVIEDVYLGCANQAGEDNRNVARMSALLAGLPVTVPGATVNRLCGSGLDAVNMAAKSVLAGEGHVYVAGGVESMSRAPLAMPKPDRAFPTGNGTIYDTTLGWRFVNARMKDLYGTEAMGETAENLAAEYGVTREEQDAFALNSHRKAVAAWDAGHFDREVVSVTVPGKKGDVTVTRDEGPRADTDLAALAKLRPAFRQGGSVTAGNSSSLNDGASAVVIASREYAEAHGLTPRAVIRTFAVAGVPPRVMGIGPVPASRKALERAGLSVSDLSVVELNEAFAAQALAVLRDLGVDPTDTRLNPNGGGIALGHPLGSSGSRLVTTLLHELERTGGRFGLATMCIGVGQGIATVIERV